MAPPSACCKTKAIVARGKDPPLSRSSPSFLIYQCQRDFVGSLEDAEKRRQLDSWNCRRLGQPANTREDVSSSQCSQKISGKSCTDKGGGLTSTSSSRVHYPESRTVLPTYPLPPYLPPSLPRRLAMSLGQELKGHGLRFHPLNAGMDNQ